MLYADLFYTIAAKKHDTEHNNINQETGYMMILRFPTGLLPHLRQAANLALVSIYYNLLILIIK